MVAEQLITKGAYAARRGVSAAAVSQYIEKGYLDGALFRGDGSPAGRKDRSAKVHPGLADDSLRRRLHLTQVIGQGKSIPERGDTAAAPTGERRSPDDADTPSPAPVARNEDADRIQRARADQAEMSAERERRAMAQEVGLYTLTAAAKAEFARTLSDLLAAIDTWLPDLASAIAAAQVEGKPLDRRAIQAVVNREWREFRTARAAGGRDRRDAIARIVDEPAEAAPAAEAA
ncbi:MAG: hypothetical protein IH626_05435 [Rhodospirillales bacterium]|nr:hypothetical protein [Rhodospirillales bacterium]